MAGVITRGKALRADLAVWDGKTSTATRLDATGGTITGLAIGNEVDVLQVYGAGTARTRLTIAGAVQQIGTAGVTLVFAPGTWTIDDNLTIPSNFTCHIPAGTIFDIASGMTLTFSGPLQRESETWTSGSGSVSYTPANNVLLHTRDFWSQTSTGKTAAEVSASITPTNYAYPELHVMRYGALGNDSFDNLTAFTNAKAVAAQYTNPPPILFPAGIYRASAALNWFQTGLTLQALGKVVIKSTAASGNIMTFDAGVGTNGERCFMLGDWTLDSTNAGVAVGLYTRNVHHSKFEVAVRNVVTSAVQIDGAVLNRYKVTCSTNEGAMTTKPANGISINGSALITQTTDCWFDLTIEGLTGGTGINIGAASGCTFIGTSEANATGLLIPAYPYGYNNTFINFDFEANTTLDIDNSGRNNTFINCVAATLLAPSVIWRATATLNTWIGGEMGLSGGAAVSVLAGATNNAFLQFICSSISDAGTGTVISGVQLTNSSAQRTQLQNLISLAGLSGTTVPAKNFRGTAVFAGVTNVTVVFPTNETNASYFVALSQSAASSGTTLVPFVTAKAVGGFVINFSAAYTGNVDWIIVR